MAERPESGLAQLLSELRRRRVFRVAAVYLVVAFALLEAADVMLPRLGLPDWTVTFVVALALLGFPLSVVLAWAFDATSDGIRRTPPLDAPDGAGAAAYGLTTKAAAVAVAVLLGTGLGAWAYLRPVPAEPGNSDAPDRRFIAVLPFASLSADADNAYFAGGIHDELLTQLSKLGELRVVSRTSVQQYAGTTRTIREIAAELGVGTVLEGSVQRAGDRVRVQAQLIDARTDEHLWAERYDRELTDVFAIQSDIAESIARALQARLSSVERARMVERPTGNAAAYDFYLRAREYQIRPTNTREDWEAAQRLLEQAIALDPDFALAHARLSELHGRMHWWTYDPTEARRQLQHEHAERAVALQPGLLEARLAVGLWHYWGRRDYDAALREFARALRDAPGNVEAIGFQAFVYRRMGRFHESVAALEQVVGLSPRDAEKLYELGTTYALVRDYAGAVRVLDRALELAPDLYDAASARGRIFVSWQGTTDSLEAAVQRATRGRAAGRSPVFDAFELARMKREPAEALRIASAAPELISLQSHYLPRDLLLGIAQRDAGNGEDARAAFTRTLAVADAAMARDPSDVRIALLRGQALAGLGRRTDAADAVAAATRLLPASVDAYTVLDVYEVQAAVLAQTGDLDGALSILERLLAGPARFSTHDLRLRPDFDPLRSHPRYRALVRAP
jgi:TolB-like protein/Tfp pilus assembly protein PilF